MCGIVCLCNYTKDICSLENELKKMNQLLQYRGPDDEGMFISPHVLMGHRRLSIIDLENGKQPMQYSISNKKYTITYNGEIYNMIEIKKELMNIGYTFHTTSDTEVILAAYDAYKEKCVEKFEGIFAFVISDGDKLFIARDQMGVKPLYYCLKDNTLIIASEIKCILSYLKEAVIDNEGIKELLGLGPSCTPGKTIYKDIYSLRPAHYMIYDGQLSIVRYWMPQDKVHTDNLEQSIQKIKSLVIDSIQKQLLSDVPISTMLSGGLDSSIITAVSSQFINHLSTYSISYEGQKDHFKAYDYQTTMDDDYIKEMIDRYHTDHHNIILTQQQLIDSLETSLIARDMPGMADIDSSFYLFSNEISNNHKVCLSGECADEIFGGYPWFHKEELMNTDDFPWSLDFPARTAFLCDNIVEKLDLKNYSKELFKNTMAAAPVSNYSEADNSLQRLTYLNIKWFMATLLSRMDRTSMFWGLEARVPFADYKILEYTYNLPRKYKFHSNKPKELLIESTRRRNLLPESILNRKKNPYPKTYDKKYESLLISQLNEILSDRNSPLYDFIDTDKVNKYLSSIKDYGKPWYGQLMAGPQLIGYYIQLDYWLRKCYY